MKISWSEIQANRLKELGASESELKARFDRIEQRDKAYQKLENTCVKAQQQRLKELREIHRRPRLCSLESRLVEALVQHDFVQVATPTIMSRGLLAKMSIGPDHPLSAQIYWLEKDKCLRPMLAPHLYFVLKDLLRLWEKPVRIFEVGACFRKESQGSQHASEFTMLNLVEMGLPSGKRRERLEQLAALVTETAGVSDYRLQSESSAVYGETIDIVTGSDGMEIGSAAMGPHPLDRAWRITDTWVGIGFGLERLLMVTEKCGSLGRFSRSLAYLDGVRLNI